MPSTIPPASDPRVHALAAATSPERIEHDVRRLVGFGTRHTLSATDSDRRGIGAARRWLFEQFEAISAEHSGSLEVSYQTTLVLGDPATRIPVDTEVVNVVAILRGRAAPNRYVVMTGDIDSRVTDVMDSTSDAPGANDDASGLAGILEAARVLARHSFDASIVFAGLSGEEQGLYGGRHLAARAREEGWQLEAVLNDDMIGNISGIDGVVDNRTFRIFSEPAPAEENEEDRIARRVTGGEVDGPSRQLARYIDRTARTYVPELEPMMVYRADRFGRGGHHRPFNEVGFPAVRIMEAHEHYHRQHQDVRVEDGVSYGDVIEGVDFAYAARITAVNIAALASLAWAPPLPRYVLVSGMVGPSTTLEWEPANSNSVFAHKLYWRETTESQWSHHRFAGPEGRHTLEGIVIDNYLFGVASVSAQGNESVVAFPKPAPRAR